MEKKFVNALAYSKVLRLLTIFVLVAVIAIDMLVIAMVAEVIGYTSPEERAKIIRLLVLLLLSSASGFPVLYLIHRSLRDQWITIGEQGIAYNSWAKKISASWDEVTKVSVVSRGRYGQASRTKGLRIDSKAGKIYALPTFVDESMPIPQMKFGISSQKFCYPNGRIKEIKIQNSDICAELQNHIPDLLNAALEYES